MPSLLPKVFFAANQALADPVLDLIEDGGRSAFSPAWRRFKLLSIFLMFRQHRYRNLVLKSGGQPPPDTIILPGVAHRALLPGRLAHFPVQLRVGASRTRRRFFAGAAVVTELRFATQSYLDLTI